MLREMRVDFDRSCLCACDEEEKGGKQSRSRDRVVPVPALSPSIMVTVMWLWAVLVLCHYIHNACCLPQDTQSITPMCTLSRTYLHMHKLDVLANTEKKKHKGVWIKAAATDSSSVIYCVFCLTAAGCVVFLTLVRICSHHRPEWAELDGGFRGGVQEEQGRRPHPPLAGVWQCDGPGSLLPRYQKEKVPFLFCFSKKKKKTTHPLRWIYLCVVCAPLLMKSVVRFSADYYSLDLGGRWRL